MPYSKLDASLVHSTIWREPDATRIVWITMLALKNKDGEVFASIPGLADVARVKLEECETALKTFLSPDPYSRNKEHQGRRIEEIPGGWFVINHDYYRRLDDDDDRREKTAARVRRHRERQKAAEQDGVTGVTGRYSNAEKREKRHTDADADADAEPTTKTTTARNWVSPFIDIWNQAFENGAGTAVAARLGKALKPLRSKHSDEHIAQQLRAYLAEIDPRFANPQSFAQKFGKWQGNVDEEARRRFIARGKK